VFITTIAIFDPDTTIDSIETNIAFIRHAAEFPFNFGRVELYAGTPLLARLQAEKRCRGDYMQWDYKLGSPDVDRVWLSCWTNLRESDRTSCGNVV
jgi:hypothetical protein